MKFRAITLSAAAAAALILPTTASADVMTFAPSKDNTLFEPTTAAPNNSNGAGPYLYAGRTGLGGGEKLRRALLAFDFSTLPAGATVTAVQLNLNVSRTARNGPATFTLRRLTSNWGEGASTTGDFSAGGTGAPAALGDATWTTPFFGAATPVSWSTPGGDLAAAASASALVGGTGPVTFASTPQLVADVQSFLATPAANFGWAILGDESPTSGPSARRFDSRNATDEFAVGPSLTVTYQVPEPGTATLLTLAALPLLTRRRRG